MEENKKIDFNLNLINRNNLTVSGTNKIISLKPELIQLDTVLGGLIIGGKNLELKKLNAGNNTAEILGTINNIKFVENADKTPFFRKLFKWFLPLIYN